MAHHPRSRHLQGRSPVLLAALLMTAGGLGAADVPPSHPKLAACQACHGVNGQSREAHIPNLGGQKREYLVLQLQAFRDGRRKNDLMAALASQLSDDDILQLATLWSRMPSAAPAPAEVVNGEPAGMLRGRMGFPADFPSGFTLYQTEVNPASSRVILRYANRAAADAAREGGPLPDGSVLITATHEAAKDASGRAVAGRALSYAGMQTQSGWGVAVPELLRNADWDYALFTSQRVRRSEVNTAACFACHKPIAHKDYVFTLEALQTFVKPKS